MKYPRILLIAVCIFSIGTAKAQGFEDFIRGGTTDANTLFNNYMTPFMKGMGYGFNNGWYNTAKPHQTFGFDLTISLNAAIVPVADQSFEFIASDYGNTRIASGPSSLPTLMGNNSTTVLENFIDNQDINAALPPGETVLGQYDAPNGIGDDVRPFSFNQVAVPSPIVQVGIGLFKGTEIKVRWLPTINNEDFNFKYFGIGGMHSISQWIPVFENLPIDISAFVGYTTIKAEYTIPAGNIAGSDQRTNFDVNTFTYQLLASAKLSVLTAYVGLGMDNFKTNFRLAGTYDPYPNPAPPIDQIPVEDRVFTDPINLEQSGSGGFRTTFGVRLKLAILTLHADYTFREYNTLTTGIGFSFR